MSEFDDKWRYLINRAGGEKNVVQERHELEHVYNLVRDCDCESYLEIGTAEGVSLLTLGSAVEKRMDFVDFDEDHTRERKNQVINILKVNHEINPYHGDSTTRTVSGRLKLHQYDCVLIDGGHDFATVLSDSILYAPLATKYVFWHDVQLPEVRAAVEWFVKRWNLGEYSTFINSPSYGYGILKCH